jgi:addiction module RelB/DinJ family antitoxin
MNTALISIKTDPLTKREAELVSSRLGMSVSTFMNMLLKQAINSREITLKNDLSPNAFLRGVIDESEKDYAAGNVARFDTPHAAADFLRSRL